MALLPKGRFAPAARKWGGTRGTQNSGTVALIYPAQPPVRQEPVDGLLQNLSVAIPLYGMQPLEGKLLSHPSGEEEVLHRFVSTRGLAARPIGHWFPPP